jgi:hypothetical protein
MMPANARWMLYCSARCDINALLSTRQNKNITRRVMAKLSLVYGLRLFPSDDLGEIGEATLTLKNGRTTRITMHLIEGSKEEIEATLRQSLEAFFDMYPEI